MSKTPPDLKVIKKDIANPAIKLHVKVRGHYDKLFKSKVLAGLPRDLAADTARRQIEHDHGIDVARAALRIASTDRDEMIATAGVNSNARQSVDGDATNQPPVDVKLDGEDNTATD